MNYYQKAQGASLILSYRFWLATFLLFLFYTGILFGQNTYYIDPTAADGGDGTQSNPYNEWSDIYPTQSNTNYLQKRGTTALLTTVSGSTYTECGISMSGATNVYFGAYDTGADPIITVNDKEPEGHFYGDNTMGIITIDGFELTSHNDWSDSETFIRTDHTLDNGGNLTVKNCTIHNGGDYSAITITSLDYLTVENCEIYDMAQECIWGTVRYGEIRGNNLYNINMKYWWEGQGAGGGDMIQISPGSIVGGGYLLIENNILDRSTTGTKFTVLCSTYDPNPQGEDYDIIIRYNHIKPPRNQPGYDDEGGQAIQIYGCGNAVIYGNYISGRGYDNQSPHSIGNIFANESVYYMYNVHDSCGGINIGGKNGIQEAHVLNNTFLGTHNTWNGAANLQVYSSIENVYHMNNIYGALEYDNYNIDPTPVIESNNIICTAGNPGLWESEAGITDWVNSDFTLLESSLSHNAGATYLNKTIEGILYDRDIDSTLLPQDTRDIGAYEYQDGGNGGGPAIVYINPDNGGDPLQDGSTDHPFDQWSDFTIESNKTYLQKRGTSITLTSNVVIDDVFNVTIGAYGDGAAPVINGGGADQAFRIDEGSGGIVIENFNIDGSDDYSTSFSRAIYIDGDLTGEGEWVESVTIRNCTIANQENALIIQKWNTGLDTLLVENCVIRDIKQEGIWGTATNATIKNCHLYNINMDWHFVGHSLAEAGGNAIQLGPGNAMDIGGTTIIEDNIIDRRETGNNFCFIYSDPLSEPGARAGIFKVYLNHNTFYAPKDTTDDGGGSSLYIIDADSLFVYGNTFSGKDYDAGSKSQYLAFVDKSYVDARYNLFDAVSHFEILNSLDNDKCFYNNTFVNIPGDDVPVIQILNKPPMVKNNIFAAYEGASIINVTAASGPLNDTSNNIVVIGDIENWDSRIGFVDYENENFTLSSGSQAIDNGINYSGWNYDIDSIYTPQGTARDIGACEFPGGGQSNLPPEILNQSFSVDENTPTNQMVGTVEATDPDAGQSLTFSIQGGNTDGAFFINSSTGDLSVANSSALNFEQISEFSLIVKVEDNGAGNLSDQATITVNLGDVNEVPVINNQSFVIQQTAANGELVGMVEASDPDGGQVLSFSITAGNADGAFQIDAANGELTVADNSVFDINVTPEYYLTVMVEDNGSGALTDDATITVTLEEVNFAPVIDDQSFSADENMSAGEEIGIVAASDPNAGQTIEFSILSGNTDGAFEIAAGTGRLSVVNEEAVNFEVNPLFTLVIQVEDDGAGNLTDEANITVTLNDVNEPPVMEDQNYVVEESIANGELVGVVDAEDPDQGQALTFSITGGNEAGAFALNSSTGELTIADNSVLNFASTPIYFLDVEVEDDGAGNLTDEAVIAVSNEEINQAPVIEDQSFSIAENSPSATLVGNVVAMDPDAGQSLTYSIVLGNALGAFEIDEMSGALSVDNASVINFEENPSFALVVKVVDNGIGNLSDEATVNVNLSDVNEAPVVESSTFDLEENSAAGMEVGTVEAEDPDNGQSLTYSIISGNIDGAFSIGQSNGTLYVNNESAINFEASPLFYLVVEVEDNGSGNLTGQGVVTINLEDINEAPEIEDQYFNVEENSAAGTEVGEVMAFDPDNGQTLTYSITSGNSQDAFTIDPNNGMITVQNQAALDITVNPIFILEVEVVDNGSGNLSDQASVVIALMGSTSVQESLTAAFDCNIYPNPAKDYVNLSAKNMQSNELNVKIIDFMGQVVFDKEYSSQDNQFETRISLDGYSQGLYIVYISSGDELEKLKMIRQ